MTSWALKPQTSKALGAIVTEVGGGVVWVVRMNHNRTHILPQRQSCGMCRVLNAMGMVS